MTTVKINLETLTKQVNEGMKKDALMAFYGLNASQMANALKGAGLKIRKFHTPAYEIITGESNTDIPKVVKVEDISSTEDNKKIDADTDTSEETRDSEIPETSEVSEDVAPQVTWKD